MNMPTNVRSVFVPVDALPQTRQWLNGWATEARRSSQQVLPSVAQVVHDLLVQGRMTWPDVQRANVYDLRVTWGRMMGLCAPPWCEHGRRLGDETCNRCSITDSLAEVS